MCFNCANKVCKGCNGENRIAQDSSMPASSASFSDLADRGIDHAYTDGSYSSNDFGQASPLASSSYRDRQQASRGDTERHAYSQGTHLANSANLAMAPPTETYRGLNFGSRPDGIGEDPGNPARSALQEAKRSNYPVNAHAAQSSATAASYLYATNTRAVTSFLVTPGTAQFQATQTSPGMTSANTYTYPRIPLDMNDPRQVARARQMASALTNAAAAINIGNPVPNPGSSNSPRSNAMREAAHMFDSNNFPHSTQHSSSAQTSEYHTTSESDDISGDPTYEPYSSPAVFTILQRTVPQHSSEVASNVDSSPLMQLDVRARDVQPLPSHSTGTQGDAGTATSSGGSSSSNASDRWANQASFFL